MAEASVMKTLPFLRMCAIKECDPRGILLPLAMREGEMDMALVDALVAQVDALYTVVTGADAIANGLSLMINVGAIQIS